jgi:dsDNA-specific endonuclease/ATPase MutS2
MFKFLASFRAFLQKFFDARKRTNAPAEDESLNEIDDGEYDPDDPFPEIVQLEIRDVIDLHSIPPRDVRRIVEEYLTEARKLNYRSVRIIHGKGRGVQREIVRGILARTPFVRAWTDAPPEAGGWGATVAHFTEIE